MSARYVDGGYVDTVSVGLDIDPFTCMTFAASGSILNLPVGVYEVCIKVYETGDSVNPIVECCKTIYVPIREDLNLDIKVDMKDIGRIAKRFGWTG